MCADDRRLSVTTLNRALLARQGLVERLDLPLVEAVEALGPLQAQHWPALPHALWSRVAGFAVADLYAALERGDLVLGTLLRNTLHLVSAREHPAYAAVVAATGADDWRRTDAPVTAEAEELRAALLRHTAAAPGTGEEIAAFIEEWLAAHPDAIDPAEVEHQRKYKWRAFLRWSALVRAPADGRWGTKAPGALRAAPRPSEPSASDRAPRAGAAAPGISDADAASGAGTGSVQAPDADAASRAGSAGAGASDVGTGWPAGSARAGASDMEAASGAGSTGADAPDANAALDAVIRRHLRAFGPAGADDIAGFIGWRTPPVRAALERLAPELEAFEDDAGRALFDLPDAPRPDPATPAPPRLLAAFDSALLAYASARRARILPDEYRDVVYERRNLRIRPTFLLDGLVAGTWAIEVRRREAVVTLTPFKRLAGRARKDLVAEAERLAVAVQPAARGHRVVVGT